MRQRSRVHVGEICGFVEFVHPETLEPVQMAPARHKRTYCARLHAIADDNQLELSAGRERAAAGFHPAVLVHRTVGFVRQHGPAAGFVLDGPEFLDDFDREAHTLY